MRYENKPGTNIMVDLETLGTRPSSVILSIGACRVTPGEPADPFYRVISIDSCKAIGLTTDPETERWWARQSIEARTIFSEPANPVEAVLSEFADYIRGFGSNSVRVWGNGSDFDNVILTAAYSALGSSIPWRFYNNRCFRTIRNLYGQGIVEPERQGVHHNALDDAMHQARILSMILRQ